jgi:hypothetical protein
LSSTPPRRGPLSLSINNRALIHGGKIIRGARETRENTKLLATDVKERKRRSEEDKKKKEAGKPEIRNSKSETNSKFK